MFYLKHNGETIFIEDDNVFTSCPDCGREHPVDLQEILGDGQGDLYGTAVCCSECSARREAIRKGTDPQIQELAARFGVDAEAVQGIVCSGLGSGLSISACFVGARLALAKLTGQQELFSVQDVADALGVSIEEAEKAIKEAGIQPVSVLVSPVFEKAFAEWEAQHRDSVD